MQTFRHTLILFILLLPGLLPAQEIPARPVPQRLVNDFAGVLTSPQTQQLERYLRTFYDSTSTQIVLVTVNSLQGYDAARFTEQIGSQWGVGKKGKDNGIIIMVKPKSGRSKGQAFIATGYGLEGVVPDAIANRIVDKEMIPHFKQNDYFGGIAAAATTLTGLTAGEFTADEYRKQTQSGGGAGLAVPFIILIIALFMIRRSRSSVYGTGHSALPLITSLFLMNSMGRSSGSHWNDFSSGSGGFGGGGGFDGFGGGSFGGGGAGGSW